MKHICIYDVFIYIYIYIYIMGGVWAYIEPIVRAEIGAEKLFLF